MIFQCVSDDLQFDPVTNTISISQRQTTLNLDAAQTAVNSDVCVDSILVHSQDNNRSSCDRPLQSNCYAVSHDKPLSDDGQDRARSRQLKPSFPISIGNTSFSHLGIDSAQMQKIERVIYVMEYLLMGNFGRNVKFVVFKNLSICLFFAAYKFLKTTNLRDV